MFAYIAFATLRSWLPAALVSAELAVRSPTARAALRVGRRGVQPAGDRRGLAAMDSRSRLVPHRARFAAACRAFTITGRTANNNIYVGCSASAPTGSHPRRLARQRVLAKVTKYGFLAGTILPDRPARTVRLLAASDTTAGPAPQRPPSPRG